MKTILKFLVALLIISFSYQTQAQGWEREYKGKSGNIFNRLVQTPDSSYWTVGRTFTDSTDEVTYAKYDKNGQLVFFKNLGEKMKSSPYIFQAKDNGVYIKAYAFKENTNAVFKINKNGNLEWKNTSDNVYNMKELKNGTILAFTGDSSIVLLDKNGKNLWKKKMGNLAVFNLPMEDQTKNSIYISGFDSGSNQYQEVELDYDGNILNKKTIFLPPFGNSFLMERKENGNYLFVTQNASTKEIIISEIKDDKTLWTKPLVKGINNIGLIDFKIVDNKILLSTSIELSSGGWYTKLFVFDEKANYVSSENFNQKLIKTYHHWIGTNDGYYASCGSSSDMQLWLSWSATIIKTKGDKKSQIINGKVTIDDDNNCKIDSLDRKITNSTIKATNPKGENFYGFTNKNGDYFVVVDTGKYTIIATGISPWFEQNCNNKIDISNQINTNNFDILLTKTVDCPYLNIDISTLGLRPCFDAVQVIKYCNNGSATAQNAYVEVQLDPNLTYSKSSIPAIAKGNNLYRFNIGDLPIDSCNQFTITSKVKCDNSLVGKTLCSKVHIFPDSLCTNNDQGKIQTSGICGSTKIDFSIKNTSGKNMITSKNYLIIEDDVMFKQGSFQLNGGQSLPISIPAKIGKTYRIIAEQINTTYGAIATTAIENCNFSSNASTGFINQFSEGDDSPFEDIDCRVVTNSYDPNDKQGFPLGVGNQQFIPKNTDIEYMIRFQNSGADTAFTVVLRDTLSKFLDPATIVPGASSHKYNFDLLESGIAKFSFFDIKLPHEKVGKELSNGFVKFRIKQRSNNPNGTVINNRAGIYFDFNEPILTNTTIHTIGENWLQIVPVKEENVENIEAKIYPNPFSESTTIEINGDYKNLIFNILDMNGKLIRSEKFDENRLIFERNNLQAGLYIYEITAEGKRVQHGKIVVQ